MPICGNRGRRRDRNGRALTPSTFFRPLLFFSLLKKKTPSKKRGLEVNKVGASRKFGIMHFVIDRSSF